MFCCKCGKQLPDGSVFCMHCGNRVGEPAAPAAPVAPAEPPVAPMQVAPPVVPVAPVTPPAPVAPPAPVIQMAPPVTPIHFNTPAEEPEAGATTALTPDQAPDYGIPASADDADAGATTALTPDQAPAFMAAQPVQPVPSTYHPYTPPTAPAPKKGNNALLIGIIAIVAVIALTVGALWFANPDLFEDLFGGTSTSDKDDKDDDKGDKGEGEPTGTGTGIGIGDTTTTTTTTIGSADTNVTEVPNAPVTTQPMEGTDVSASDVYTKGYISRDVYYNVWADLTYTIPSDWENGSDTEYASYEGLNTECGLYLKRLNTTTYTNEQFVIAFEKLPYDGYEETDYIQSVLSQLESQYTSLGLQMETGEIYTITLSGKEWKDTSVKLNDGALYQRFLVTEQDGYMIIITISAADKTTLEQTLMNFSPVE